MRLCTTLKRLTPRLKISGAGPPDGGTRGFMKRIFALDNERSDQDRTNEATGHLDDLRSEFLLDLSHQLRTPVTAMKLAMDGLLSQIQESLTPTQQDLANISRRNLERVSALVERQLGLLQMMAGERRVCRRLTDLDLLLRSLGRRPQDGNADDDDDRPVVERAAGLDPSGPLYAFTDPEHLAVVLDCILSVGTPRTTRTIRVGYDDGKFEYQMDILVDHIGPDHAGTRGEVPATAAAQDFETRAARAVIEQLGGEVVIDKDNSRRWARIRLPRYPDCEDDST